ncbi:hypothetical protein HOLleu_31271 [Holothuria leucospilota]|uniref:Uncharacterized protein n=1 Tax=Holothuria leucospilota TaxID=206669 RepID=A0A9Q1BG58_HOLLE|nr:hypothetical protein HOLleu_31271 [Holothuria leucospilota]
MLRLIAHHAMLPRCVHHIWNALLHVGRQMENFMLQKSRIIETKMFHNHFS